MKYSIVIDTNVIISALRSASGASFKLLSLIDSSKFEINISVPLLFEYEDAAKRDLHNSKLQKKGIDDILDYICAISKKQKIFYLWRPYLKDPKDDFILELAVKSGCDYIITYNKQDFRGVEKFSIKLLTPKEFLIKIGEIV